MRHVIAIFLIFCLVPLPGTSAQETDKTIRLFTFAGGQKHYYTGVDWLKFDIQQKIDIVEQARTGALKMNAVMTLPAELYVAELDRMFGENTSVRHIELGQAIQGIAISFKDWNDGTDPEERLEEALSDERS